jgi:hypothetical protein
MGQAGVNHFLDGKTLGVYLRQVEPEILKTRRLGSWRLLNPMDRQPWGSRLSHVTK